jgi:hypothetical protein
MSTKTKLLLGAGAGLVVLAVVLGVWAFGAQNRPTASTLSVSPETRSKQAYEAGLMALSKEQTASAVELFQSAITINPDSDDAKTALAKLNSGASSSSGTSTTASSGGQSSIAPKPAPVAPIGPWDKKLDMSELVPATYTDYLLGSVDQSDSEVSLSGVPTKDGATVTNVIWVVHDRGTAARASDFIKTISRTIYKHDVSQVKVHDISAYFGTNGKELATVSFARGRYVFEVVITSTREPGKEQAFAQRAAAAFGTAP